VGARTRTAPAPAQRRASEVAAMHGTP